MPTVMTRCPETGAIVATQLEMEMEALAKVRTPRAIYCRVCRIGHIVAAPDLWLGSDVAGVHPLAGTTWATRLSGGGPAEVGEPRLSRERRFDVSGEPAFPQRLPQRVGTGVSPR